MFLNVIDREWQDYLRAMDDLRQGVNLRAYGQRDPLIEYKKDAFEMFETLIATIKAKVVSAEFRSATGARIQRMIAASSVRTNASEITVTEGEAAQAREEERAERAQAAPKTIGDVFASMMSRPGAAAAVNRMAMPHAPSPTVGRNDPCPCGSGKKYKKCCGRNLV